VECPDIAEALDSSGQTTYQHLPHIFKSKEMKQQTPWLEHVWTALETYDTSRRPDLVPGVLDDILTKGDFTLCVKIMTSITENRVKYNCCIAKPAFDTAQWVELKSSASRGMYS
jgi:hypothetical protein